MVGSKTRRSRVILAPHAGVQRIVEFGHADVLLLSVLRVSIRQKVVGTCIVQKPFP
jgi:hypothetical protein